MGLSQSHFQSRLNKAWTFRFNQKLEECTYLVSRLKNEVGLAAAPTLASLMGLEAKYRPELILDLLLIMSSLVRAQRDFAQNRTLFDLGTEWLKHQSLKASFSYFHERGLNYLRVGDTWKAFEDFQVAVAARPNEIQRIVASANLFLCRENLGLEINLAELKKLEQKAQSLALTGVESQLRCLSWRQLDRQGQSLKILREAKKLLSQKKLIGQESYLMAWLSLLPGSALYLGIDNIYVHNFIESPVKIFEQAYRMRTLRGYIHPDDFNNMKPSQWANRFYLWTWQWLLDPQKYAIEKVLRLLEQSELFDKAHLFAHEDVLMVGNALRWLGFFDSVHVSLVQRAVARFQQNLNLEYPLFSFEKLVVQLLSALRDKDQLLSAGLRAELESHELFAESPLRELLPMLSIAPGSQLKALRARILNVIDTAHAAQVATALSVDLRSGQISGAVQAAVVSLPLAKALALFQQSSVISLELFCRECFGLVRFDAFVHNAKVYNLLARIKKLIPENQKKSAAISLRSNFIHQNVDWSFIRLIQDDVAAQSLQGHPLWRRFVWQQSSAEAGGHSFNTKKAPIKIESSFEFMQSFFSDSVLKSRSELELLLGRSRSSVGRFLTEWQKKGWIQVIGQGRAIRYSLVDKRKAKRNLNL